MPSATRSSVGSASLDAPTTPSGRCSPGERYRQERPVHDYAGPEGVERVTASSPSGARATASSSSGYPDSVGPVQPELGPASAVDGSFATMWRSAPLQDPVGQWLEVSLPKPRPVEHVDVWAAVDGFTGIPVRRVRVTAGEQSVEQEIDPESGFARVRLSGAPVSSLRVRVTAVRGSAPTGVVALSEVTVPGVQAAQEAVLPGAGVAPGTDVHFRADPGRRSCTGTNATLRCDPELARTGDESTGLRRVFRTTAPGTWGLSGTAVATASPATLELLDPPRGGARMRASSVLGNDPLVRPPSPTTATLRPCGRAPSGTPPPRSPCRGRASALSPASGSSSRGSAARVPGTALVGIGGRVLEVPVDGDDIVPLPPVRADEVTVSFPVDTHDPDAVILPTAVAELELDGSRTSHTVRRAPRPPERRAGSGRQ